MRCSRTLVIVLLSACVLLSSLPFSAAEDLHSKTDSLFHCRRPFSAMDTFAAVAKANTVQNCDFHYFTVTAASAQLSCVTATPNEASVGSRTPADDKETTTEALMNADASCNVTVRWSMRRAENVAQLLQRQVGTDKDYFTQNTVGVDAASSDTSTAGIDTARHRVSSPKDAPASPFMTEEDDVWRYTVSLRAKGDSTVHYKGYHDGDGYSLCCDALPEADCTWMAAEQGDNDLAADEDVNPNFATKMHRVLRGCPLPFPAATASAEHEDGEINEGVFGALVGGGRVALTDLDDDDHIDAGWVAGEFEGRLTKPLHRLVEGPWEVTVQIWRRRQREQHLTNSRRSAEVTDAASDQTVEPEVLGRVIIPFTLDLSQMREDKSQKLKESVALTTDRGFEDIVIGPAFGPPHTVQTSENDGEDL